MNELLNNSTRSAAFCMEVLESEVTIYFSEVPGHNVKQNIVDILTTSFQRNVQENLFVSNDQDYAK